MDHIVGALQSLVKGVGCCVVGYNHEVHIVGKGVQGSAKRLDLRFTSDAKLDVVAGFQGG